MRRAGHKSPAAATRYQHATEDRDRVLADALAELAPVTPIRARDTHRDVRHEGPRHDWPCRRRTDRDTAQTSTYMPVPAPTCAASDGGV